MNEPRFSCGFEDKTEKLASGALEVVHSLAAGKAWDLKVGGERLGQRQS